MNQIRSLIIPFAAPPNPVSWFDYTHQNFNIFEKWGCWCCCLGFYTLVIALFLLFLLCPSLFCFPANLESLCLLHTSLSFCAPPQLTSLGSVCPIPAQHTPSPPAGFSTPLISWPQCLQGKQLKWLLFSCCFLVYLIYIIQCITFLWTRDRSIPLNVFYPLAI